jgi:hypothetical protein
MYNLNLAGQLGLEPRTAVLETVVLPLKLLTYNYYFISLYNNLARVCRIELQSIGSEPIVLPLNYTPIYWQADKDSNPELRIWNPPFCQLNYRPIKSGRSGEIRTRSL